MLKTIFCWALLLSGCQIVMAQDIAQGKIKFQECETCHSLVPGRAGLGPVLQGVVGRKAASVDGFRYSPALKKSRIDWAPENLNQFLANPQALVPGNRMPYSGMPDPVDRANLIAYLMSVQ
jgi:cytochrome c